ncbi:MAG: hypothetical protein JSR82_23000 [Verrucomicrobia bacterium]|nr:hypothetical protein [Verrucomicrobiota bacterium]
MPAPNAPSGAFDATPTNVPSDAADSLDEISAVLNATSLHANAGEPARLGNLATANLVVSTNTGSQNAVANQQAATQLALAVLGRTVNAVQNLGPVTARTSVDVLTNNEVAQAIADLKAALDPGRGPRPIPPSPGVRHLLQLLKRLLAQLARIEQENAALQGDGSAGNPFATTAGLWVTAPVTIAFPGLDPQQVDLSLSGRSLKAR